MTDEWRSKKSWVETSQTSAFHANDSHFASNIRIPCAPIDGGSTDMVIEIWHGLGSREDWGFRPSIRSSAAKTQLYRLFSLEYETYSFAWYISMRQWRYIYILPSILPVIKCWFSWLALELGICWLRELDNTIGICDAFGYDNLIMKGSEGKEIKNETSLSTQRESRVHIGSDVWDWAWNAARAWWFSVGREQQRQSCTG